MKPIKSEFNWDSLKGKKIRFLANPYTTKLQPMIHWVVDPRIAEKRKEKLEKRKETIGRILNGKTEDN